MVVVDVNARDESYLLYNMCNNPLGNDVYFLPYILFENGGYTSLSF